MFFEGSLQEGISTALQQSKLVVCFVTDNETESQQWETEFLADDSIKAPLESQAVVLRLVAGSEEAGFLEALFPVPKKPTVVIIQNGQLKEYLHAGTPKEDFVRRVGAAFAAPSSQPQLSSAPVQQDTRPQASQAPVPPPSGTDDNLYDDDNPPAAATPSATTSSTEQRAQQEAQAALAEREKKLEAEKKAKAKAEAEAEARRRTDERCKPCNPEPNYAEQVKQRKLKGDDERRRILKRIEDDKRERKQREAEERKARQLLSASPEGEAASSETAPIPLSRRQPTGSKGEFCNLQVRLLDGTTIRSRFPSEKTLRTDVRKWIDEERTDGDSPYTFRVVLTPLPNKMIEQSEETQSLLSLGLAPSATLVLVPSKYVRAFSRSSENVTRGVGSFFGLFISIYAAIISALGGVFGMLFGRRGSADEGMPLETMNTSRNSRIRGFQNPDDRRRDAQLYNGNSLNFEPRRDEDGEEDN
ncbi:hypothetical protein F5X96DRAFT_616858 [Biscogniauxia mediterranea]|nr:hypothetical protein F5X96DRAFT_616858 [Biscogniauxia mediterranea]